MSNNYSVKYWVVMLRMRAIADKFRNDKHKA